MAPISMTLSDLECHFSCFSVCLSPIHQWIWHVLTTLCVYMDGKVSVVFNRNCVWKMRLFEVRSPTGSHVHRKSGSIKDIVQYITLLLHIINRKYHMAYWFVPFLYWLVPFLMTWMTLKVIRLLQDLWNATLGIFVQHSAQFKLTRHVAWSLGDSEASC